MATMSFVCANVLWIAPPVFVLSAALLALLIIRIVRTVRQARIITVPLLHEQVVEFQEAGSVVLAIEGPLLTTRFAGLTYTLLSPFSTEIEGRSLLFRVRTRGFSRATMGIRTYAIPAPGRYTFQIPGLREEPPAHDAYRVVFMRPYCARVVAFIIGIVLCSWLTIASVVLFFIRPASGGNG